VLASPREVKDRPKKIRLTNDHTFSSLGNGRVSRVIGRGSRVIGRGSKVEVEGQKSRSRVKSRG
jgi:hypothetical protein